MIKKLYNVTPFNYDCDKKEKTELSVNMEAGRVLEDWLVANECETLRIDSHIQQLQKAENIINKTIIDRLLDEYGERIDYGDKFVPIESLRLLCDQLGDELSIVKSLRRLSYNLESIKEGENNE